LKAVVNITHTTMLDGHNSNAKITVGYDSAYSDNVYVDGKKVVMDETLTTHEDSEVKKKVIATSASVYVNWYKIARKEDKLSCNSVTIDSGSSTVFAN
jgi:hypothetical protein